MNIRPGMRRPFCLIFRTSIGSTPASEAKITRPSVVT